LWYGGPQLSRQNLFRHGKIILTTAKSFWPTGVIKKHLSEVKFSERRTKLKQKNKAARKKILPFVTQYHPALPDLKKILMGK